MTAPSNDNSPRRFDQCDETCTVDCGHCKGAGRSNDEPTDDAQKVVLIQRRSDEGSAGWADPIGDVRWLLEHVERLSARVLTVTTERDQWQQATSHLDARLEAVTTELAAFHAECDNATNDGLNLVAMHIKATKRAEIAEQRLDMARQALIGLDYFTPEQIGPDLGPRIVEYASHAEAETLRLRAQLDQIRDACDRAEAEGQDDAIERGVAVHVYADVSTSALRRIIGADSTPGSVTTTGRCDYRGTDGSACDRPNGHADHADAQGHPVPWGVHTETNRCRWCGGENPLHRTNESGAAVLSGTE